MAREGAAKKAASRKAAKKPVASKKAAVRVSPKAAPAKAAKPKGPAAEAPAKKARAPPRDASRGPVQRTRVVVPTAFYEPNKGAIKAPLKEHGLKWTFLGEGKGLYKRERDVHCFTQFKDDGVHYSVWGDDQKDVDAILAAWRKLAGESQWAAWTSAGETAAQVEEQAKESEALKLWKLGEPQRRPGEPDFFFVRRVAEWQAKKPA